MSRVLARAPGRRHLDSATSGCEQRRMRRSTTRTGARVLAACAATACAVTWSALAAVPARAGVVLTTEISSVGSDKQPKDTRGGRMLLDGERVRMELDG